MTSKEVIPIDPLPIKEEKMDLNQDFCACIVDTKINHRNVSLTENLETLPDQTKPEETI